MHTENSEPERESEASAEASNTASSTVHGERVTTPESIDRGNVLLRECSVLPNVLPKVYGNINYIYQNSISTGRM